MSPFLNAYMLPHIRGNSKDNVICRIFFHETTTITSREFFFVLCKIIFFFVDYEFKCNGWFLVTWIAAVSQQKQERILSKYIVRKEVTVCTTKDECRQCKEL